MSIRKMLANCTKFESLTPVNTQWVRAATCAQEQRMVFHNLGFQIGQTWVSAALVPVLAPRLCFWASPPGFPSSASPSVQRALGLRCGGWALGSAWNTIGAQHIEMLPQQSPNPFFQQLWPMPFHQIGRAHV